MKTSNSWKQISKLDGVRAVAIILVLASHLGLGNLVPGGFGVTVFFFLSGYLITSILRDEAAKTGRVNLGEFYIRRTFRIMPPLYITMIIGVMMITTGFLSTSATIEGLFAQVIFLSNYDGWFGFGSGLPIPLWSLAVEEHFYLLFPLFISFLISRGISASGAALWCAGACGLVLAVRIATLVLSPSDAELIYFMSHTRFDSLLFGCILALWNNPVLDKQSWRPSFWILIGALAALAACLLYRDPVFRETFRYSFQGASLFVVFAYVLSWDNVATKLLATWPILWLGRFSYSIYLVHLIILALVDQYLPAMNHLESAIIVIIGSIAFAAAMYISVERPSHAARRAIIKAWKAKRLSAANG